MVGEINAVLGARWWSWQGWDGRMGLLESPLHVFGQVPSHGWLKHLAVCWGRGDAPRTHLSAQPTWMHPSDGI